MRIKQYTLENGEIIYYPRAEYCHDAKSLIKLNNALNKLNYRINGKNKRAMARGVKLLEVFEESKKYHILKKLNFFGRLKLLFRGVK